MVGSGHSIPVLMDLNFFSFPIVAFGMRLQTISMTTILVGCYGTNSSQNRRIGHCQPEHLHVCRGGLTWFIEPCASCKMGEFYPQSSKSERASLRDHWHFSIKLLLTSAVFRFHVFRLEEIPCQKKNVNNDLMCHLEIAENLFLIRISLN